MDQEADAGDDEDHDRGEGIELEGERSLEAPRGDPGEERFDERLALRS